MRRQKEQELEVLCGSVRFWEGEEPHRLGELLYMGPVKCTPLNTPNAEARDRHLVLFSQCIVLLSVSQRLSAFVFEVALNFSFKNVDTFVRPLFFFNFLQKKINLNGISFNGHDDSEIQRLSFEIVGKILKETGRCSLF